MNIKNIFWFAVAMLIQTGIIMAKSHDGKAGFTGSPGEENCTMCHSGTVNSGSGSVVISSNITNNIYTPGKTYELTVTVSQKGIKLFGFDVEALLTKNNENAGTFIITDNASTRLITENVDNAARNNITHQLNGGKTDDSKTFKFSWTAPAEGAGNVMFYVAAVAANGDDTPSGDYVYTTTQNFTSSSGGNNEGSTTVYSDNAFGSPRLLNGQSADVTNKGTLLFTVSHRFGRVGLGAYELWGLDQGTIRLAMEYGLIKNLSVYYAHSNYQKTFEGGLKYKILRQCKGEKNTPLTLDVYLSAELTALKWMNTQQKNYFSSRLSYVAQVLLARKMCDNLVLQLVPTMIHSNLAPSFAYPNDVYSLGAGAHYALNKRFALSGEYYWLIPGQIDKTYQSSAVIGFEIKTANHVFQLLFANTQPMFEKAFISENTGKIGKGDIYFGFNLLRKFNIAKPKIKV